MIGIDLLGAIDPSVYARTLTVGERVKIVNPALPSVNSLGTVRVFFPNGSPPIVGPAARVVLDAGGSDLLVSVKDVVSMSPAKPAKSFMDRVSDFFGGLTKTPEYVDPALAPESEDFFDKTVVGPVKVWHTLAGGVVIVIGGVVLWKSRR